MTFAASSTFALQAAPKDRAAARQSAQQEFKRMSEAMIKEKGLLNHAQAALLLDVSTKRVGELVRLGKLTDFTFLGRKYVSMREIWERNKQELKAGRPPMPVGKRIKVRLKAALKHDSVQMRQGGFGGPYQKKLQEDRKRQFDEKVKTTWQGIRGKSKK
jgi:hypothetical protein